MRAVITDEREGEWLLKHMLSEFNEWKRPSAETLAFFRKQYRTTEMWLEGRGFVVSEEYKTWNRTEFKEREAGTE